MSAEKAAEIMNPQRGMWVRMIRALRLPEYSKRKGFDALAQLLDVFYNKNYTTWLGKVNAAKQQNATKRVRTIETTPWNVLPVHCFLPCFELE